MGVIFPAANSLAGRISRIPGFPLTKSDVKYWITLRISPDDSAVLEKIQSLKNKWDLGNRREVIRDIFGSQFLDRLSGKKLLPDSEPDPYCFD